MEENRFKLDYSIIGRTIQKYRTAANMTQAQLAEAIGITQKHVSRIELGHHSPHFDVMYAISKVFNIPLDALALEGSMPNRNAEIQGIIDEIQGFSPKQLEMLKDNIAVIKKYDF